MNMSKCSIQSMVWWSGKMPMPLDRYMNIAVESSRESQHGLRSHRRWRWCDSQPNISMIDTVPTFLILLCCGDESASSQVQVSTPGKDTSMAQNQVRCSPQPCPRGMARPEYCRWSTTSSSTVSRSGRSIMEADHTYSYLSRPWRLEISLLVESYGFFAIVSLCNRVIMRSRRTSCTGSSDKWPDWRWSKSNLPANVQPSRSNKVQCPESSIMQHSLLCSV